MEVEKNRLPSRRGAYPISDLNGRQDVVTHGFSEEKAKQVRIEEGLFPPPESNIHGGYAISDLDGRQDVVTHGFSEVKVRSI